MKKITVELIERFKNHLVDEEKSQATVEKYVRDILGFVDWLWKRELQKEAVLEYKCYLTENYEPTSVNSMLSSINGFF